MYSMIVVMVAGPSTGIPISCIFHRKNVKRKKVTCIIIIRDESNAFITSRAQLFVIDFINLSWADYV